VALDAAGDVLVADADNHRIRRIVSAGVRTVTTVAGSGTPDLKNGASAQASFNFPNDLVVDSAGNVFLIEFSNHTVRRIARDGEVFTFAGNGTPGYADGRGTAARFNQPAGIALDAAGNLYVTEWSNHRVRKIQRDGTVTTVAGTNTAGFKDGQGSAALLNTPDGIAVDADGNLYIAEFGNHAVRQITPSGYVLTLAGQGTPGYADGDQSQALFNRPTGIALHPDGSLIVTESENHRIRRIDLHPGVIHPPRETPLLELGLTSALTIYGLPGETYRIEYADEARPSNWIALTTLTLTKPLEKWTDPRPATRSRRVYRAVLQ
jgi:sugar lactone lactonase YvrE